jgi:hypothetical protein
MGKEIEFKAQGYLKSTRLDKEGSKTVSIEFSASEAVELAKLELMSRDLRNHQPVLLEVRIRESDEKEKGGGAAEIQNSGRITRKNRRLF